MPIRSQIHVNSLLTTMSIKYANDAKNFIAHRAFPGIDVQKQSDIYPVFSKADFLRLGMNPRVPGEQPKFEDFEIDVSNTYYCKGWDAACKLTDEEKANWDNVLDSDKSKVRFLEEKARIRKEYQFVASAMTTGVWGADHAGVASGATGTEFVQFDATGAVLISVVRDRLNTFQEQSGGRECNTMIVGEDVWNCWIDHSEMIARLPSTSLQVVQEQDVAKVFGVPNLYRAGAVYNTSAQGATASYSRMAPKSVLLLHVTSAPSLDEPSAGYEFRWAPVDQMKNGAVGIDKYYSRERKADIYESIVYFDFKITASDLGLYMYDAVG